MKSWSAARWLANKISVRSTKPADWLENTGLKIWIKKDFLLSRVTYNYIYIYQYALANRITKGTPA